MPSPDLPPTPELDLSAHDLRPLVIDAATAHAEGYVEYEADGTVVCRHQIGRAHV